MDNKERQDLIRATLRTIHEAKWRLESERDDLIKQIAEKDRQLQAWVKEFNELEGQPPSGRIPRGEPLRRINELFVANEKAQSRGATIKEIADAIGLNWTTVRNVLKNEKNGFVETDGAWRKKADAEEPVQTLTSKVRSISS
jgi:hypothetical protein